MVSHCRWAKEERTCWLWAQCREQFKKKIKLRYGEESFQAKICSLKTLLFHFGFIHLPIPNAFSPTTNTHTHTCTYMCICVYICTLNITTWVISNPLSFCKDHCICMEKCITKWEVFRSGEETEFWAYFGEEFKLYQQNMRDISF